jgi:hypothetical protein
VLLRLAYLSVTNIVRPVQAATDERPGQGRRNPGLRHQLTVLQRQLDGDKVRFTPADRALLAALLHRLPRPTLRRSDCSCARIPCWAGIATSSPDATPPDPGRSVQAGRGPSHSIRAHVLRVNPVGCQNWVMASDLRFSRRCDAHIGRTASNDAVNWPARLRTRTRLRPSAKPMIATGLSTGLSMAPARPSTRAGPAGPGQADERWSGLEHLRRHVGGARRGRGGSPRWYTRKTTSSCRIANRPANRRSGRPVGTRLPGVGGWPGQHPDTVARS